MYMYLYSNIVLIKAQRRLFACLSSISHLKYWLRSDVFGPIFFFVKLQEVGSLLIGALHNPT